MTMQVFSPERVWVTGGGIGGWVGDQDLGQEQQMRMLFGRNHQGKTRLHRASTMCCIVAMLPAYTFPWSKVVYTTTRTCWSCMGLDPSVGLLPYFPRSPGV